MKNQFLKFNLILAFIFSIGLISCTEDDIDECTATVWYQDSDSDGLGNPNISIEDCEQPDGYVADNTDEDDTNPDCDVLTWYEDADGDGLGNPDVTKDACVQPDGYVSDSSDTNDSPFKYLLGLSLDSTDLYPFHLLEEIESGTASIFDAQEIPNIPYNVPVIGKDGYVYLNSADKLTKYETDESGVLVDLGSVTNTGISGGPVSTFLSDTQLLTSTGAKAATGGAFSYQIINVETMTEESNGSITLPVAATDSKASPSLFIPKNGKLYVPFYHAASNWVAYDYASVAIYDATTLAYEKTITTDKGANLGLSVVNSHFFSENGDLYLITDNSNYWGAREDKPSGLTRINANEDDFDTDYFLNLSEKVNDNPTCGMAYAGNNKVVFQVFRNDLISAYSDYQGSKVIEYYVVDLDTEAVTQLDIDLSQYPRHMVKSIGDDKVAIVANTEAGEFIYTYNSSTDTLVKGLEYVGTETINSIIIIE